MISPMVQALPDQGNMPLHAIDKREIVLRI